MVKIVFGIILLVLVIFLLLPVGAEIRYDRELKLWLRIAGLRLGILPKKKGKHKKKETKPSDDEEGKKPDPEEEKQSFFQKLRSLSSTLKLIMKLLGTFCRYSRKRIWIKPLDVSITYGREDAAKTAISVGGIWSALYGVLPVLDKVFRVKAHRFSVEPEYQNPGFSVCAKGIVMTRPVHIILIGTVLLFQYLRYQLKEKKEVKKHE